MRALGGLAIPAGLAAIAAALAVLTGRPPHPVPDIKRVEVAEALRQRDVAISVLIEKAEKFEKRIAALEPKKSKEVRK